MALDPKVVEQTIESIRPSLQADGGDVQFVGVDEAGVVSVELTGACAGCALAGQTLAYGIERVLKERIEGVTAVRAV